MAFGMLMWHLGGLLCRLQGRLPPVQHCPVPMNSGSVPEKRIESTFQPSVAGKAVHARTSQRALQTHWPHPAHTDWNT